MVAAPWASIHSNGLNLPQPLCTSSLKLPLPPPFPMAHCSVVEGHQCCNCLLDPHFHCHPLPTPPTGAAETKCAKLLKQLLLLLPSSSPPVSHALSDCCVFSSSTSVSSYVIVPSRDPPFACLPPPVSLLLDFASSFSCLYLHALSSSIRYAVHCPLCCPLPSIIVACHCAIGNAFMFVIVFLPSPQRSPSSPSPTQSWKSFSSPWIVAFVVCFPFPATIAALSTHLLRLPLP